jgi:hypothetical protein
MSTNSQLSPVTSGLLSLNLANQTSSSNLPPVPQPVEPSTVLVVKFDYAAKEQHELDIHKGERLALIDNSKNWWLVRKLDSDLTGFVILYYKKN